MTAPVAGLALPLRIVSLDPPLEMHLIMQHGEDRYGIATCGKVENAYALITAANRAPVYEQLLALVERYASECAECNGSGTEYYCGYGNEQIAGTCRKCEDIRAALTAATGTEPTEQVKP